MELAWAQAVCRYTGKPVLHLAPLAVSSQMVREAEKFGIPAHLGDGEGICVTNYQKLDHFDLSKFGAVILDESSILIDRWALPHQADPVLPVHSLDRKSTRLNSSH